MAKTFRDLVQEKKALGREEFVSMIQERKRRVDAGEDREDVEADFIAQSEPAPKKKRTRAKKDKT